MPQGGVCCRQRSDLLKVEADWGKALPAPSNAFDAVVCNTWPYRDRATTMMGIQGDEVEDFDGWRWR